MNFDPEKYARTVVKQLSQTGLNLQPKAFQTPWFTQLVKPPHQRSGSTDQK